MATRIIIFFIFALLFSGCNSDSTSTVDTSVTQTTIEYSTESLEVGYFVDAPVEGLRYETKSRSGFTDESGAFFYQSGEEVSFFIDQLELGVISKIPDDAVVMPHDLLSLDRTDLDNEEVLKMSKLLQSFDDDGDISKNIKLSSVQMPQKTFKTLTDEEIEEYASLNMKTLRDDDEVKEHLQNTLINLAILDSEAVVKDEEVIEDIVTTPTTEHNGSVEVSEDVEVADDANITVSEDANESDEVPTTQTTPSSSGGSTTVTVTQTNQIKVDQFGYLPSMKKIAIVSVPKSGFNANKFSEPANTLYVKKKSDDSVVFSSAISSWNGGATDTQSGDKVYRFDFSALSSEGEYYIYDDTNKIKSYDFNISSSIYDEVLKKALKTFFYQRAGFNKSAQYASSWADEASHLGSEQDSQARLMNQADPSISDATTQKDLSGGWYDAGDFNKYVNYADGTVHDLLFAYEENKKIWGDDWDIPESGNGVADILDEIKYELDWLLKMQNSDGSVIHKVASIEWGDVSPPSSDTIKRRYSTTSAGATISVAGVMAHGALVFRDIDKEVSKAFGVLMSDNKLKGLSARSIFVIDREGEVVYKEIVSEVTEEPDYEAALEAIKQAR